MSANWKVDSRPFFFYSIAPMTSQKLLLMGLWSVTHLLPGWSMVMP